jgi:hypothetical protein
MKDYKDKSVLRLSSALCVCCAMLLFGLSPVVSATAQGTAGDDVTVVAEGMAPLNDDVTAAEEEAVWDAKRNAVEQAVGVVLRTHTVGRDHTVLRDDIEARAQGFVRRWETLPGSRRIEKVGGARILHIQVQATVALLSMIHSLSDMADVYKDLERPRLRVEIAGEGKAAGLAQPAQTAVVAALQGQGFEMAESGPAEVVLTGHLELVPTIHLGDHGAPYGVGDYVAACKASLTLQAVSTASEDVLFSLKVIGNGRSFNSDQDAGSEAVSDAAEALVKAGQTPFLDRLLVRWAHERQEGHTVTVQVSGLAEAERGALRQALRSMRGFLQFTAELGDHNRTTFRFITRLDTRSVRRRLAAWHSGSTLSDSSLTVLNERGPIILCAVHAPPRLSHR